jgi:hypothetical protein
MDADQPAPRAVFPRNPSLARLFRDHSARWEIEQVPRGTEWVAVHKDPEGWCRIVGARDLAGLRYFIEIAEREEAAEQEAGPA